jgi:hypothetical protein
LIAGRRNGTLAPSRAVGTRPVRTGPESLGEDRPMNNDELRALNRNRQIQQIAWLTNDLEASMQAWIDTLRIGPWRVFRFTHETVRDLHVGGRRVEEPFEFRIAITHVGDMEIELIQPVRGPMIYQEYLDRRGPGLHHIKEKIPDERMAGVVADYEARGVRVTQTGWFVKDVHFYLDTEPRLDFVFELGNCPYQELPPDMVSVYPPEETT